MGGLGPLIGVTLPVSTPCVDVLDCYMNAERDCVTLEHMGLPDYGDRQICLRLFRQEGQRSLGNRYAFLVFQRTGV